MQMRIDSLSRSVTYSYCIPLPPFAWATHGYEPVAITVAPVSSNTQSLPDFFQVEKTLTEFVGGAEVVNVTLVPAFGSVITSV
ncbi:unknown [Anaerotruncus sp. CAG:390]|nr:unknown [Anaerotruncus sp. CAG:390]